MKQTMSTHEIAEAIVAYDAANSIVNNKRANWSLAGAFALAEYLEGIEADTGEQMDFNAVEIICEWTEYKSLQEWADEHYGVDSDGKGWKWALSIEEMSDDEIDDEIRAHIQDNSTLIEFEGGVVVSDF